MLRFIIISGLVAIAAVAQTATTTVLAINPASPVIGQEVTLTATIQPASATGTVEFTDDFEILGTAQLTNGQAALKHVFKKPGHYRLRAVYAGNGALASSKTAFIATRIGFLPVSTFGPGQPYTPFPEVITIDANLDGKADQFASTVSFPNGIEYESTVAFRYGENGGFKTVFSANKGGAVVLHVARLNTDDIADALYSISYRRSNFPFCGFYLSTGPSTWSENTGCAPSSVRTDINGDNLDDFINPGSFFTPASVIINQNGSFKTVPLMHPGALIYVGDWDGDTMTDLLVSIGSEIQLLVGQGDGLFKPPVTIATVAAAQGALSITEANGDGRPDLLLSAGNVYTLYPGHGAATPDGIFLAPAIATLMPGIPTLFSLNAPATATSLQLLFNSSLNPSGGCLIDVNPAARTIRLQSGGAWLGPISFGSGMLSNGKCSVYGTGATISTATNVSAVIPVALSGASSSPLKSYIRVIFPVSDSGYREGGVVNLQSLTSTPIAVSVSPSTGSGSSVTFRVLADSQNGDVSVVNLLMNDTIEAANACFVEVNALAGTIRLLDSTGTTWLSAQIGSTQQLGNQQCTTDPSKVVFTPQGTGMYVDIPLRFLPAFTGIKNVYALVTAGASASGWRQLGTWRVPTSATAPSSPEVRSITPISNVGKIATVTATFGNAADSLYLGYLLFLPTPNVVQYTAQGTCLIEYNKISNGVRLINGAGNDWLGPLSGEVIRPGAPVLANNICSVDVSKIAISRIGDSLSETVTVEFSENVPAGPMGTFLQAFDIYGFYTGMTQFGNWVARFGNDAYPFLVGGTNYSGGVYSSIVASATFTPTNLTMIHILIGSSVSDPAPCQIVYIPGSNTTPPPLYLINDSGSGLIGPVGNLVSNSRCTIDLSASSVSISQSPIPLVSVNASVRFNTIFTGPKNIYSIAFDNTGKTTHWVLNGTFTAQ